MIEGLNYWNFEELVKGCRILSRLPECDKAEKEFRHFVLVPYHQFRTSNTELVKYREKTGPRFGAYLARVDCTDVRHVVFAFESEADREALLEGTKIVTVRTKPKVIADFG